MRAWKRPRGRGFTLLEVLIALAIFSIGSLALIPLFGMAAWGSRGGRDLTNATTLARTYVDKLRNTPFFNIGGGPGCPAACTPPAGEVTDSHFVVTWAVTAVNGTTYPLFASPPGPAPSPNMKRVEVTVVCTTCATRRLSDPTQGIRMVTLISERS
jgi:prepilin-type N-terminal cleavage/methylation domain-containing protein